MDSGSAKVASATDFIHCNVGFEATGAGHSIGRMRFSSAPPPTAQSFLSPGKFEVTP